MKCCGHTFWLSLALKVEVALPFLCFAPGPEDIRFVALFDGTALWRSCSSLHREALTICSLAFRMVILKLLIPPLCS